MAWIYLAESVDSPLPWRNGLGPSPIVKSINTVRAFCSQECEASTCRARLSGMMSRVCPLEGSWIFQPSISFTEDSPARISALQELESAWEASEVDFSSTSQGLSKKQTRDLYFSKTSQQLELVASMVSSKHLPSSGMIVDGQLYQPQKLVPSTFVNDGSYLPTPTASDYGKNNGRNSKDPEKSRDRWSLTVRARRGKLPNHPPGRLNPEWIEQAMGYRSSWTEIGDLETQWFRSKPKQHSKS